MLCQSIKLLFVFFALSVSANTEPKENPMDEFLSNQIELLDLELELFGTPANNSIIAIASINVYEPEEEVTLNVDTTNYLPKDFDAKKGMDGIDWGSFNLYEVEEDVELNFDVKSHLPKDFNPYKGMITLKSQGICFF